MNLDKWMWRNPRPLKPGKYEVGVSLARRAKPWGDRFNTNQNPHRCMSGARLASVANKNRQRKKGPLVRFGGRVR